MANKERTIYFILITAIFNAVFRLSSDSIITLFRLLLPYSVVLIYRIDKRFCKSLIKMLIWLFIITSIQTIITIRCFYPSIHTKTLKHLFSFYMHYVSMSVVYGLVYSLMIIQKNKFFIKSIHFISRLVKFILCIYVIYTLFHFEPLSFKLFGNINVFGCVLAGGIIAILFDTVTKKCLKYLYVLMIIIILLHNDSKLALFGGIFELMLFGIYNISQRFPYLKKVVFLTLIFICIFCVYAFFMSEIIINGYSVKELVQVPLNQIYSGVYFPRSNESFTYRSNCIIGITEIIKTSFGIGVGVGNTSLILKTLMPDPDGYLDPYSVSSHIWWYEIMADIGWLVIIPMIGFYIRSVNDYRILKTTYPRLFAQIFIISFPLWCMSSSGLYAEFFSVIMISLSVLLTRYKRTE